MNDDPPDDPLPQIKDKLSDIHKDLEGGFQTMHDRLDREANDRIWSLERMWAALGLLRNDILELFRRWPP